MHRLRCGDDATSGTVELILQTETHTETQQQELKSAIGNHRPQRRKPTMPASVLH